MSGAGNDTDSAAARAAVVYVWSGFALGFLFRAFAVAALVYWVEIAGLTPFQLVMTGTALEIAYFLAEVPTGVLADFYSRKWSVVAAFVLIGSGFFVTGMTTAVVPILIAQAVWGIGFTFQSGADTAWVTDEVKEPELVDELILRRGRMRLIGSVVGSLLGIVGGAWSLVWTIRIVGILTLAFAAVLALAMTESGFTRVEHRVTWRDALDQARKGVQRARESSIVVTILTAGLVIGVASETIDRLWVFHIVDTVGIPSAGGDTVWWTGSLQLAGLLAGALLLGVAEKRPPSQQAITKVAGALATITAIAVIALAVAPIYAVAAFGVVGRDLARSVTAPIEQTAINREAAPEVRATMLSLHGQVDSLGQIIGGIGIGAVAAAAGVVPAFLVCAVLYGLAASIYFARPLGH